MDVRTVRNCSTKFSSMEVDRPPIVEKANLEIGGDLLGSIAIYISNQARCVREEILCVELENLMADRLANRVLNERANLAWRIGATAVTRAYGYRS